MVNWFPSFSCPPRLCLPPLALRLAPRATQIAGMWYPKNLRDVSCLLGCCTIADVGGSHRPILLSQMSLVWRSYVHGAGIRPMLGERGAGKWSRSSIIWTGVGDCGVIGERTAEVLGQKDFRYTTLISTVRDFQNISWMIRQRFRPVHSFHHHRIHHLSRKFRRRLNCSFLIWNKI